MQSIKIPSVHYILTNVLLRYSILIENEITDTSFRPFPNLVEGDSFLLGLSCNDKVHDSSIIFEIPIYSSYIISRNDNIEKKYFSSTDYATKNCQ